MSLPFPARGLLLFKQQRQQPHKLSCLYRVVCNCFLSSPATAFICLNFCLISELGESGTRDAYSMLWGVSLRWVKVGQFWRPRLVKSQSLNQEKV